MKAVQEVCQMALGTSINIIWGEWDCVPRAYTLAPMNMIVGTRIEFTPNR